MATYFVSRGSAEIRHEHWCCGGWSTVGQPRPVCVLACWKTPNLEAR